MVISGEMKVSKVVTEHPLASRVFSRHHIDFCCGGGKSLSEICDGKKIDVDDLIDEINHELGDKEDDSKRWDQASTSDLINYIVNHYHDDLREELPRLLTMAEKAYRSHGQIRTKIYFELYSIISTLKTDIFQHLLREERILFPMIKNKYLAVLNGPINVMIDNHDEIGDILMYMRKLTNDYTIPENACNTVRALWKGLEELEKDLHQHVHLENNILFPRALEESKHLPTHNP